MYYHLKLFIKILFLKSIICVMFNLPSRSFDGVAAIDDSNWYLKLLNYIEIDNNKIFWAVKSQFSTAFPVSNPYI